MQPPAFRHYIDLFDKAAYEIANDDGGTNSSSLSSSSSSLSSSLSLSSSMTREFHSEKIIVDGTPSLLTVNRGWLNFLNWSIPTNTKRPHPLVRIKSLTRVIVLSSFFVTKRKKEKKEKKSCK